MGKVLLFLLGISQAVYNYALLEGDNSCSPPCTDHGRCVNGICFCKDPYHGDTCQDKLDTDPRVSIALFIVIQLLALIIGFMLAFIIKCCYDVCFNREPNEEELEDDKWDATGGTDT